MSFVASLLLKSWATASKVVKEKMDDGSGTGAEQGRRREGGTAGLLQSGEKFETVPKLRGAQKRGTSWRREGHPPTTKGIFHRPPGWRSFRMRHLFISSPGTRQRFSWYLGSFDKNVVT